MRNMAATANKSPNLKNRGVCFMCVSVICESFFNSLLQLATAQRALRRHELSRMARATRRRRSPGLLLQELRVVRGEELHSEPQDGVFGSCTRTTTSATLADESHAVKRCNCRGEVGRRGGGGGGVCDRFERIQCNCRRLLFFSLRLC